MEQYRFSDALTGSEVTFDYENGKTYLVHGTTDYLSCKSLFFPGCSFINYAIPLVARVFDALYECGECDGISVLCCGKILSYERGGDVIRELYEMDLANHLAQCGVERIVCACPNCVIALREALSLNPDTTGISVEALPEVLAANGYRIDEAIVTSHFSKIKGEFPLLCTHDSCPDRLLGKFADGLRDILPSKLWIDPIHSRKHSVCCGSLLRAQGKEEEANKCTKLNADEALEKDCDGIITACLSCAFQLNMFQKEIPAIHYLEFLFDWYIDWNRVGNWMKLRFLFDENLGIEDENSTRKFLALRKDSDSAHHHKENKNEIESRYIEPDTGHHHL